jgi:hypothetical protein
LLDNLRFIRYLSNKKKNSIIIGDCIEGLVKVYS